MDVPEPLVRARIRDHLWTWTYAVATQAKRVGAPAPSDLREADAWLLILALRQVLRCVEWGIAHADQCHDANRRDRLQEARAGFDASVPNAAGVRDILSHFDEYEKGQGRLQRKDGSPGLVMITRESDDSYQLTLIDGYAIDIPSANEAALELAHRCMEILSDS